MGRVAQNGFSGCDISALTGLFFTTFLKIALQFFSVNFGLPQVCKVWLELSESMLPLEHLTSNILI